MRTTWAGSLGILLLVGGGAQAEEFQWRPARQAAMVPVVSHEPLVTLGRPIVTLGRPVPAAETAVAEDTPPVSAAPITQATFSQPLLDRPQPIVRAQFPDPPPPGPPGPSLVPPPGVGAIPPGPNEPYNCGVVNEPPPGGGHFYDKFLHLFSSGEAGTRSAFQSDHGFDDKFISPVSNPFLFEDPRALTEVRPIFIYQGTPSKNAVFRGGHIEYFGLQARLAVTERLDLVLNKVGFDWIEPHSESGEFHDHVGLSELWLGPKYTFYRCENTGTIAAAGLTFQIPIGSGTVFQNTGSLSLEPYLTAAQNFGRSSYGSFNVMDTVGYTFAIDSKRTDYVFNSLHLDYDVANLHKIYPLIELNYFRYTSAGKQRDLDFEGRDLFNFGSTMVSGHDDLSLALGARYKYSEAIQAGVAVEGPLTGRHDLLDYRVLVDLIFRY